MTVHTSLTSAKFMLLLIMTSNTESSNSKNLETICETSTCKSDESCVTILNDQAKEISEKLLVLSIAKNGKTEDSELRATIYDVQGVAKEIKLDGLNNVREERYPLNISIKLLMTEMKIELTGNKQRQKIRYISMDYEGLSFSLTWNTVLVKQRPLFLTIPSEINQDSKHLSTMCMKRSEACDDTAGWQIQSQSRPIKTVKCSWDEIKGSELPVGRYCCCEGECVGHSLISPDKRLPNVSADTLCGAQRNDSKQTKLQILTVWLVALVLVLLMVCAVLIVVVIIQKRRQKTLKEAVEPEQNNVATDQNVPPEEEPQQASEIGSLFSKTIHNQNTAEDLSTPENQEPNADDEKDLDSNDF